MTGGLSHSDLEHLRGFIAAHFRGLFGREPDELELWLLRTELEELVDGDHAEKRRVRRATRQIAERRGLSIRHNADQQEVCLILLHVALLATPTIRRLVAERQEGSAMS